MYSENFQKAVSSFTLAFQYLFWKEVGRMYLSVFVS